MNRDDGILWLLAANFALLSFLAIGGANAIIPEMHRQTVEVFGWMSSERFRDLFTIAQAAPGPNIMVVTLIGWYTAGLPGAVVATVAVTAPTCFLAYGVTRVWERFRAARWRMAVQAGLVPVTLGLLAASAMIIAETAVTGAVALVLTAATALTLFFTRLHPLLFMGVGALLGIGGLI